MTERKRAWLPVAFWKGVLYLANSNDIGGVWRRRIQLAHSESENKGVPPNILSCQNFNM